MRSSDGSDDMMVPNDPVSRIYICFCQKKFTTYPGVYLHLKSKHIQFFETYKKLKITKLFQKMESKEGSEVYKLQKEAQLDKNNINFSEKIFKEGKKKTPPPAFPIRETPQSTLSQYKSSNNSSTQKEISSSIYNFHFHNDSGLENNPFMLPFGHPFNLPIPPFSHIPPFPPYLPEPLQMESMRPIKQLMQKFYLQNRFDKNLARKAMLKLMLYIQENYELVKDPRVNGLSFLSYCDKFDSLYLGPLVQKKLQVLNQQKKTDQNSDKQFLKIEIDILEHFQVWLASIQQKKKEPFWGPMT